MRVGHHGKMKLGIHAVERTNGRRDAGRLSAEIEGLARWSIRDEKTRQGKGKKVVSHLTFKHR